MNDDDKDAIKTARRWIIGLFVLVALLGVVGTVGNRAIDLIWYPWEVKMKTGMIRNSNSYVTTQQSALRQFYIGYLNADSDAAKSAQLMQMKEIADTIPGDVQSDIQVFLNIHSTSN